MDLISDSAVYFDALYAEAEQPWLKDVYVTPENWGRIAGMRSIVILGATGSGKSVLAAILEQTAHLSAEGQHLVVPWRPLPQVDNAGIAFDSFLAELMEACAMALLRRFAYQPALYLNASEAARHLFLWFTQKYIRQDRRYVLNKLYEEAGQQENKALQLLLTLEVPRLFHEQTTALQILRELTSALARIGINGVWVIVDGLEPLLAVTAAQTKELFVTLLSTLALFEIDRFAIKLFAPLEVSDILLSSSGAIRRRFDIAYLQWTEEQLITIVVRRLSALVKQPDFQIANLCETPKLLIHLRTYGGGSPRGWLTLLRPFVDAYLRQRSPLTETQYLLLYQRHPPRLYFDHQQKRILVGYRVIEKISPQSVRLFAYLYQQVGRLCTREELYYCAIEGYNYVPQLGEPTYRDPTIWKSAFENAIYRLRQAIELEPKQPIYVLTERDRGIRLAHTG